MDVDNEIHNDTGSHLDDDYKKDTWESLQSEIKQKIIKFVSLKTRNAIKPVCKQYLDIVTDLNHQQTKLVVVGKRERFELPTTANLLCNLTEHAFDRTLMIRLPGKDEERFVKNFPNLVAVHLSPMHNGLASLFSQMCSNLVHLSYSGEENGLSGLELKQKGWTCLKLPNELPYADKFVESLGLSTLKFCTITIWNDDVFEERLRQGLVGFSMSPARRDRLELIEDNAMDTEVLYDVFPFDGLIKILCQMPKLTTIQGKGDHDDLVKLGRLNGLTKLSWKGSVDVRWTATQLKDALNTWGHRLRSLRIKVYLHQYLVIRAVVDTCPNLEELHVQGKREEVPDKLDDEVFTKNSIREFEILKKLTKLKTLSLDMREVDVKFLKMFDPEIPELEALGNLNYVQMTIKQLIRYQHEISKHK